MQFTKLFSRAKFIIMVPVFIVCMFTHTRLRKLSARESLLGTENLPRQKHNGNEHSVKNI